MDEDFTRKFEEEEEDEEGTPSSPTFKIRSSIELKRIQTLSQSREEYNADKPSADLIQHYGLSAVRCFEMGENPTLALMALMPFKLGEFSLGQEIYQLLFSTIEKKSTQSDEEIVKAELTAFSRRLDGILTSIAKFHSDPTNDPYLIQTAMGLQMLMVAAMMKASSVGDPTYEATVSRQLRYKLDNFRLYRINNQKYQNSIIYPSEKFLDPKKTEPEIFYTLTTYNPYVFFTTATVDTKQKPDDLAATADNIRNGFNSAFTMAENNQFSDALTIIETTLQTKQFGNFISGHLNRNNYPGLSLILDYLSKEDTSPEKQEFSLTVLSKVLKKTPGFEIDDLFHLDRGKHFLTTLLTLKPKSPHATLLLAKVFEALANKAPRMSQQRREIGEQPKTNPSLLALYLTAQETTSFSRKIAAFIIGGAFILIGAITLTLAITTFPLLPLYIVGGVFTAIGISAGVGGLAMSEPVKEKTPPNNPAIQRNLGSWLTAYGYSALSNETLLQLFENSPALVHTIDVTRDFGILRPLVQDETWDNVMPQLEKSFGEDKSKIVALLVQNADIFKTTVTHIDQLKTLNDWATLPSLDDAKKRSLKDNMSNIISQDDDYFNRLIDNGCAPVTRTTIPSYREIGEARGSVQTRSTEYPDAYQMLWTIFKGDKSMEQLIKSKQTAAHAAAQKSVFGEAPPASQIVKQIKTPSEEVENTKIDTTRKLDQYA